ncbi:MAG TPA: hypothetical protein VH170_05410 [Chthoniobacterales bacterium]|jgi:hypothetical protein|nr:hypothetical protein [Chthoniobacterales bacterium]
MSIFRAIISLSILCVTSAHAQLNQASSLQEVEFSHLSQRDPNPLAEKALAIHPEQWKHAESEHFIYHFVHSYVATPVSVEAEFHYRVIAKALEREQPAGDIKSNIYIFERPEEWQEFQAYGNLEKWTGGIHSGGSLFIQRNPSYKYTDNSLGHEIVHLVLHRFYTDAIPCWLDEGLAQFISKDSHASYERARGYTSKPHSDAIAPGELIPLTNLIALTRPPSDRVRIFYDESERLVRFLAITDKPSFLILIDSIARHQPLEMVLPKLYGGRFPTSAALDEQFRNYAAKDFGTTLQQASNE